MPDERIEISEEPTVERRAPTGSIEGPSPWLSIWLSPRATIRRIVNGNPAYFVMTLAFLAGVCRALERAEFRDLGENMPVDKIVGNAVISGAFGGWITFWILTALIDGLGTVFNGKATLEEIRAATAWGLVPSVVILPLWCIKLFLIGSDNFTKESPILESQPELWLPYFGIVGVELVVSFWGFVILGNTIAEVQGFRSAWKGLANFFLAIVAFLIPVLMIGFAVVKLLSWM